jgi:hypothetical protein
MEVKHWCKEHGFTEFYQNGRTKYCIKCRNEKRKAKRNELKRRAVEALGGKCQCCGYNKCLAALEFHHLDPKIKDFELSQRDSWDKIEVELKKCVLLCSNCHKEAHASDFHIYSV